MDSSISHENANLGLNSIELNSKERILGSNLVMSWRAGVRGGGGGMAGKRMIQIAADIHAVTPRFVLTLVHVIPCAIKLRKG